MDNRQYFYIVPNVVIMRLLRSKVGNYSSNCELCYLIEIEHLQIQVDSQKTLRCRKPLCKQIIRQGLHCVEVYDVRACKIGSSYFLVVSLLGHKARQVSPVKSQAITAGLFVTGGAVRWFKYLCSCILDTLKVMLLFTVIITGIFGILFAALYLLLI